MPKANPATPTSDETLTWQDKPAKTQPEPDPGPGGKGGSALDWTKDGEAQHVTPPAKSP
mgnify:CR=1 FL=1